MLPPVNRTAIAQAAHVVCLGWHNPRAVNRWVYETNVFWLAVGRHLELNKEN